MGIETITRAAKKSYEKYFALQANGVDKTIFSIPDEDTSAAFMLDRFVQTPAGIVYRDANNASHVRPYSPGTGYVYEVPRASEKTPIGEDLRDAAATGVDPTSPQAVHVRKIMDDIIRDHVSGHNMTKWKQALDVLVDGYFYAKGSTGTDIGLDINFSRAVANVMTHDFTGADTQPIAFKEMQDQLVEQGCPTTNMVMLAGASWITDIFADSEVIAFMDSNAANMLLRTEMMPPQLRNAHGLTVLGVYRAPGMLAPVYICTFAPGSSYYAYKGASAAAWVAATKAVMFSLDSPMYRVLRGVDALTDNGVVTRQVADIVFDTFHENDPITDFVRSQSRHCFVPADINHTCVSTGTFS